MISFFKMSYWKYIWEGIKLYIKGTNMVNKAVSDTAQDYMNNNGYTIERATTQACYDLGVIDCQEYNNIMQTLRSQGKW